MNSKSQESQSWGAPPGILPKPMTNMHTLNNTEMKSLDVTWSQALVQSTTSASFPVTTFCTCSPTSAQELHPNSTKATAFTYPSSYCSQSLEKATDTLLSWQVSQWKIIISAKNPKRLKKKKLDDDRAKSKPKWCIKFLSVHTADPHLFWITNSSGERLTTFLHFM